MAVILKYNGANPFGTRTPYVSVESLIQDQNGYISEITRYTISGSRPRPSCTANFSNYKDDIDALLAAFRSQFKTFEVVENGVVVTSETNCIVRSVNFPENSFQSFYQYEIVIDAFKSYQGLGIENPTETYDTSQPDSPITTIKHSVSCRGIGPNAVDRAIAFVNSRKGVLIPEASADSTVYPAILSRSYSINRMTGDVSLNTTYVYNEDDNFQYATLTYTCEVAEGDDSTAITISGDFQGHAVDGGNEMQKARTRFDLTDWQAIAQLEWQNFGGTSLLGEHLQFAVTENPLEGRVNFTLTWNTNSQEGVYIQENWSVLRSYEGEPTCFRYQGVVKTDYGCVGQRFTAVKALADATNWANRAAILWAKYGTGESLSSIAQSRSKTESPFQGTVSVSFTYCHDSTQSCGCVENLKYNLSFDEPIEQYVSQPVLRGRGMWITQDLGFKNRRKMSISGSARRTKCCTVEQAKSFLKTRINFLSSYYFNYLDKILEEAQMEATDSGDQISFSYSWSAQV